MSYPWGIEAWLLEGAHAVIHNHPFPHRIIGREFTPSKVVPTEYLPKPIISGERFSLIAFWEALFGKSKGKN